MRGGRLGKRVVLRPSLRTAMGGGANARTSLANSVTGMGGTYPGPMTSGSGTGASPASARVGPEIATLL